MEVDRIGLVLAKVAELRSKMTNCIQKELANGDKGDGETDTKNTKAGPDTELEGDYDEETESILNIRDALESLEAQLSSLQALQQQQWYEKEVSLAEIRMSQKKLLEKLKEYKGEHLEVVHEAITFAGETVEDNSDLLLPPYPSWPSRSLVSDNDYLQQFPLGNIKSHNGVIGNVHKVTLGRSIHESGKDRSQNESGNPRGRLKVLMGALAKAAITVLGVVSVLTLAGYEPTLKKKDNNVNFSGLFEQQEDGGRGMAAVECPAGKVAVVENGEVRCLVKERVEIPFDSLIAHPDVKYGCG